MVNYLIDLLLENIPSILALVVVSVVIFRFKFVRKITKIGSIETRDNKGIIINNSKSSVSEFDKNN